MTRAAKLASLVLLFLVCAGVDQVNRVGGTRMKTFRVPVSSTMTVTTDSLPGWTQVTEIGWRSSLVSADSAYVHYHNGLQGIQIPTQNSVSYTGRLLRNLILDRISTNTSIVAIYVNKSPAGWPAFLYLWGN